MKILYPEIGVCGLSCRLCPIYHVEGKGRCEGCKSAGRMKVGCPFITCAVKKKGIEFCWECGESADCERWRNHRERGKKIDSFKCYQKLEQDIDFIKKNGTKEFRRSQKRREAILRRMLEEFNEGRSKTYYTIAATVMEVEELRNAVSKAVKNSVGLDIKSKSIVLHELLDEVAVRKKYILKLRK